MTLEEVSYRSNSSLGLLFTKHLSMGYINGQSKRAPCPVQGMKDTNNSPETAF